MSSSEPTSAGPSPVALGILWDGMFGENYLGSVNGVGLQFDETDAGAKRLVLEALEWLLRRGLVRLFSVDKKLGPSGAEIPWSGPADEQLQRLDALYTNESDDWERWWFACWFANTAAGNDLARRHPPEPEPDDA